MQNAATTADMTTGHCTAQLKPDGLRITMSRYGASVPARLPRAIVDQKSILLLVDDVCQLPPAPRHAGCPLAIYAPYLLIFTSGSRVELSAAVYPDGCRAVVVGADGEHMLTESLREHLARALGVPPSDLAPSP